MTSGRNSGIRSRFECPAPTSSSTTRKPCSRSASASAPKRPTSSRRASRNSTATLRGSRFDPRTSAASAAGSSSWSSCRRRDRGSRTTAARRAGIPGRQTSPPRSAGKRLSSSAPRCSAAAILNRSYGAISRPFDHCPRESASIPTMLRWRTEKIGWKWVTIASAASRRRKEGPDSGSAGSGRGSWFAALWSRMWVWVSTPIGSARPDLSRSRSN